MAANDGLILTQKSFCGGSEGRAIRFTDCAYGLHGLQLDVSTATNNFGGTHPYESCKTYYRNSWGWPWKRTGQYEYLSTYPLFYTGFGPYDSDTFKHFWNKASFYGYASGYSGESGYGYAPNMIWPSRSGIPKFEDEVGAEEHSGQIYPPETDGKYRLLLNKELAKTLIDEYTLSEAPQVRGYWGDMEKYAPLISMRFYTPSQMYSSAGSWSNGSSGNARFFLEGLGHIYFFANFAGVGAKYAFVSKWGDGSHLSLADGISPIKGGKGPLCIPTCDFAMKYYAYPNTFNSGGNNYDDWRANRYEHFIQIKNFTKMSPTLAYHGILVLVPNSNCVKPGGRLRIRCTVNGGTSDEATMWVDFLACKIRYSKLMFDEGDSGYNVILGYGAFFNLPISPSVTSHSNGSAGGMYMNTGSSFNFSFSKSDYDGIQYYTSGGWT